MGQFSLMKRSDSHPDCPVNRKPTPTALTSECGTTPGQYLTRVELATRLRVSISTLKRREKDGLVARHFGPRTVRYAIQDVLAFEASAAARGIGR